MNPPERTSQAQIQPLSLVGGLSQRDNAYLSHERMIERWEKFETGLGGRPTDLKIPWFSIEKEHIEPRKIQAVVFISWLEHSLHCITFNMQCHSIVVFRHFQ